MIDDASPEALTDAYQVPKPPTHLRRAGKQLWRAVCADWQIEHDSDDLEVLSSPPRPLTAPLRPARSYARPGPELGLTAWRTSGRAQRST